MLVAAVPEKDMQNTVKGVKEWLHDVLFKFRDSLLRTTTQVSGKVGNSTLVPSTIPEPIVT